jgi:hypothetical protein
MNLNKRDEKEKTKVIMACSRRLRGLLTAWLPRPRSWAVDPYDSQYCPRLELALHTTSLEGGGTSYFNAPKYFL